MPRKPIDPSPQEGTRPVNLKMLAEYLDLSPATVSLVMNNSPVAKSIPERTRERVLAAAKKLDYQPNVFARSLRMRQSLTIGVIVPELSEGYFTLVMMGVESHLLQAGYLYFLASHLWRKDLMVEYPRLLMKRSVDGFIFVNTSPEEPVERPVVTISGHKRAAGVSNVVLNHQRAAYLALKHLYDLGHRRIAFMKGQRYSIDSDFRWEGIVNIAREMGLIVHADLAIYLEAYSWSPELGYPVVRDLLARTRDFTAIFCFNDTAAIGAIRAIRDAGLRCPEDISVVGFDDIISAAYHTPSLTTVRQPLRQMGEAAAQLLLKRIQNPKDPYPDEIVLEPELIVRESTSGIFRTAPARPRKAAGKRPKSKSTAKSGPRSDS